MKPQNLMVNHLRKWPFWAVNPHFTAICIGMIFRIGFGSAQLHRSTVPLLLPVLLRCRLHPDGRRSTVIQASNGSWGHKTYDGVAMETHLIGVCSRLLDGSLSAKEAAWLGNVPQLLLLALFLLSNNKGGFPCLQLSSGLVLLFPQDNFFYRTDISYQFILPSTNSRFEC